MFVEYSLIIHTLQWSVWIHNPHLEVRLHLQSIDTPRCINVLVVPVRRGAHPLLVSAICRSNQLQTFALQLRPVLINLATKFTSISVGRLSQWNLQILQKHYGGEIFLACNTTIIFVSLIWVKGGLCTPEPFEVPWKVAKLHARIPSWAPRSCGWTSNSYPFYKFADIDSPFETV